MADRPNCLVDISAEWTKEAAKYIAATAVRFEAYGRSEQHTT